MISIPAWPPQRLRSIHWSPLLGLLALLVSLVAGQAAPPRPAPAHSAGTTHTSPPLVFSPHTSQTDPALRFQAHGLGGSLVFSADAVMLTLPAPATDRSMERAAGTIIRMELLGTDGAASLAGDGRLAGTSSSFTGRDPARWRRGLPTYAGLIYHGLYPGIDLHYAGSSGRLKGTYSVASGTDPRQIRWRYHGAQSVTLDRQTGALQISLPDASQRTLSEDAPIAWQERGEQRVPVSIGYALAADGSVGFRLGSYDPAQPLTIDPTLDYSSYLGGSGNDAGRAITADRQGNVYLTGRTGSSDFPTRQPLQPTLPYRSCLGDVFVTKWSSSGQLIYSTFLGGGDCESGEAITVDGEGNAYITGTTLSTDFPTHQALQPEFASRCDYSCPDTFVAKLSADGSALRYSTYLGGSDQDTAAAIGIDSAGNAYVAGTTLSNDFPTMQPLQAQRKGYGGEPFVAKLSADGSALRYSTYLGGSEFEISYGLAVDPAGQAVVVGFTGSDDFPTTAQAFQAAGSRDAFVARLAADGRSLVYSTYLGGSRDDQANAVVLDRAGDAYITGFTRSTDFPTRQTLLVAGGESSAFVAKLSADGSALRYSTYLGGSDDENGLFTDYETESGSAIAVDSAGGVTVVGATNATNFPTRRALQESLGGPDNCGEDDFIACADAFMVQISPAGSALVSATYLGGKAEDIATGVALDSQGYVYLTGVTSSENFPVKQSAYPARNQDAFITRIDTRGKLLFIPLLLR